MKKLFFLFVLFFAAVDSQAQENSVPYNAGGFGHFFVGPAYFVPGQLSDYLAKPDVLNANLDTRIGTMTGGEGAALFGKFIIGGGGFGQSILKQTHDSFRINMAFGGGYLKFGYLTNFSKGNLCYLYGGFGWAGMNVRLENLANQSLVRFNRRTPIYPGVKADYTLPANIYEVGVSYKRIISHRPGNFQGGFMLGVDLGVQAIVPNDEWISSKDEAVSGPTVPGAFFNPYLRLTIGGGGFKVK